jgi:hypothetical protein
MLRTLRREITQCHAKRIRCRDDFVAVRDDEQYWGIADASTKEPQEV